MSTIMLEFAVGEAPDQVSPADADTVVVAAVAAGVAAIRLLDRTPGGRAVDPSVAAAHLAGRHPDIGWLVDVPTTHNAPYNLARRILSFDRATGGRAGLVLIPGAGDEVSDAAVPDPEATEAAERWAEYATILTRLWESFPATALLGDQDRAVVAEDTLIRPIDFSGRFYRVAGPLDGPSSAQGRPVLIATDPASLGWARITAVADAVIVEGGEIVSAAAELAASSVTAGHHRDSVALFARTGSADEIEDLRVRGADGIVLAVTGVAPAILAALRTLPQPTTSDERDTLRAAFTLPIPERVLL